MSASRKIQIAKAMMFATILLIVGFQVYWINKLYRDEWKGLQRETDVLFRETVYKLQLSNFKSDTTFFKGKPDNLFNIEAINVIKKKAASTNDGDTTHPKIIIQFKETNTLKANGNKTDSLIKEGFKVSISKSEGVAKPATHFIFRRTNKDSVDAPGADTMYRLMQQQIEALRRGGDTGASITIIKTGKQPGEEVLPVKTQNENISATKKRIIITSPEKSNTDPSTNTNEPPVKIFTTSALVDTISSKQLDSAYKKELQKAGIKIPFNIIEYRNLKNVEIPVDTTRLATAPVPVGMIKPTYYQADFYSASPFLVGKIASQLVLSILLVAFTIASFVVLYRNVLAQQRLAEIKNEFISNITHELKTPIATVQVAIEAMKNFNALQNPERTKEYLDISSSELQRLSLLVDKVLKLSMFEKKEVELNKETFDLEALVKEVLHTMRLQFEKCGGKVYFNTSGSHFYINADRLHITSVIYNLVDNAIKYCKQDLVVEINLEDKPNTIELSVKDNGIGISPEFKDKVFEKFFRVPMHNKHNIKGYGLGLSYVSHIVQQHNGSIKVESIPGEGSEFIVQLPKAVV